MSRKLFLALTLLSLTGCESVQLSKTDSALLGALGGAAVGAAAHKHFKASAKDAAVYGAVAGGILGYVAGSDRKSTHTVQAESSYEMKTEDGKTVHVHESWYTTDSQPVPQR
jgi:outer membrane lipoprotein SlyB